MSEQTYKVLVADDTLANRTLMRAYLTRLGFETLMAEDGQDAIDKFDTLQPDIVLMDLMMPIMDGFEATRLIKERCSARWVPLIIISAMGAETDIVKGLEAGADDYLTKPLSYQIFAAKMHNLTRSLGLQKGVSEAYRRVSAVSNAVIDGIITADEQGLIVDSNMAAQAIFGYGEDELLQLGFTELLAASCRDDYARYTQKLFQEAGPSEVDGVLEVVGVRKSGQQFPLELGLSQLELTGRRLYISTARDITPRKLVEKELADNAARLQEYHDDAEHEGMLAKEIMERLIRRDGLEDPRIHHFVTPAQRFSGDLVVAASSADGCQYLMLADATGHGLAAAVSVLPVMTMFYRGAANNQSLTQMITDINNELHGMLPLGRFVSAAFVRLDRKQALGEVWVGGVPDILAIAPDGTLASRFVSNELPMGIVSIFPGGCMPQKFEIAPGYQLVLCSDGLIEATDAHDVAFGEEGLCQALRLPSDQRLESVAQALMAHLQGTAAHDDISLLLVDL